MSYHPPEVVYMSTDRVPFTQVPDVILEDERSSQAERLLYWALWYHVNVKRGEPIVWPGQRRLRELTKLGTNQVVDGLRDLNEHGYLKRLSEGSNRTSAKYLLTLGDALPHGSTPDSALPHGSAALPSESARATEREQNNKTKEQESEGPDASATTSPPSGKPIRQPPSLRRHKGEVLADYDRRKARYLQIAFRIGDELPDGHCPNGHDVFAQLYQDFNERDYDPAGLIGESCQRCDGDAPDLVGMFDAEVKDRRTEVASDSA